MKKGFVVLLNVALLSSIALPIFSQPSTKSVETFVMDSFDKEDGEWTWAVNASRFVAEGYPKSGLFDGIPNSLKPLRRPDDGDPKVFGVQASFNRKGDNWFEVYPQKDGKPYEPEFIGTVKQLDFWVWGANYNYKLEVIIRDCEGVVHVLRAGTMMFNGWRNIIVNIPGWIGQHSRMRNGRPNLTFVGFRVRSDPDEFVDNFPIYFDQLKYSTYSLSDIFDGYELKDTDFSGGSSEGSTADNASNTEEGI